MTKQKFEILEERFQEYLGLHSCVGCSSGSAALHLGLESLMLSPGSEVIVPDYTMIACARAVTLANLKPVFVDCLDNLCINPFAIRKAITANTTAIMAVHIYGRSCDMTMIHAIAKEFNLRVIEDMAELHGVSPHEKTDVACWSFYQNKVIHGEEGGAIAFKEGLIYSVSLARSLRCLGFGSSHNFLHLPRGMNYRLSNVHADLILASLEKVRTNLNNRFKVFQYFEEEIPKESHLTNSAMISPWVYPVLLPESFGYSAQSKVVNYLNELGISARQGFKPMTTQPEYRDGLTPCPNALRLSKRVCYLPINPAFDRQTVSKMAQGFSQAIAEVSKTLVP